MSELASELRQVLYFTFEAGPIRRVVLRLYRDRPWWPEAVKTGWLVDARRLASAAKCKREEVWSALSKLSELRCAEILSREPDDHVRIRLSEDLPRSRAWSPRAGDVGVPSNKDYTRRVVGVEQKNGYVSYVCPRGSDPSRVHRLRADSWRRFARGVVRWEHASG